MSSAISFNIVFPKGEKIRTIIVTVSRNWMLNKISSLNISTKAPLPDYQENKPFQGAFNLDLNCYNIAQELLDTYYWDPSHTLYIKGTVINLLAIFFNNFSNTLGKEERLFLNDAEKIKKQIELLHENLHEPWPDLKTIGVNCNMGKSKFMSLFAKIYGINYYSYYLQVRMQNAYNLLLNGLSVSEAGRSVGYTNLGHFSKVYKEHFGVSPSLIS
ncbi:Regulatory protein PchR [compost metagenome]